jgi:PAS domain-containing protein
MAHQTTVLPNGEEAGILAEAIVETIGQPLVILTGDLKIQSANRAFYKTFRVEPAGTEGQMIYDLGNRQWDIPDLRRLLSELLPGNEFFEDFEVEHDFPGSGRGASCCSTRARTMAEAHHPG